MNILEISGLTKHYADKTALDNVSFNVEAARYADFSALTAQGKTTLLRIINSILVSDA